MQKRKTLTYSILSRNSNDRVEAGTVITAAVSAILAHDGSGPVIASTLTDGGIRRLAAADKAVFVYDHYFPAKTSREAALQKTARDFAEKNGILLIPGEGITHHVIAERGITAPGSILVGADSHTCTAGAFGMFAVGLGATDVASVLATGKLWIQVPEVFRIKLVNKLDRSVNGYDLALSVLSRVRFGGAVGKSVEYFGPGVESIGMHDRMRLSNITVEMGAVTGLFEADERCRDWLQGRNADLSSSDCCRHDPDNDHCDIEIDLAAIEPMIARPHRPDNSMALSRMEDIRVNQVFIGSCTGGFIDDLEAAAGILRNRNVHPGVRLLIGPATRKVYIEALDSGCFRALLKAGAVIMPPGCGSCLGNIGALADGEVELATQNRNFCGRVGSPRASIYLGSAVTAAKVALAGRITGSQACK